MPQPSVMGSFYPPNPGFSGGYSPSSNVFPGYASSFPPYLPSYMPGGLIPAETPNTTGTITDEHIRVSLLSAIEDKLKRRMREQFSQNQAELETLRRTHQELVQGKQRLDDTLKRLEREQVTFSFVELFFFALLRLLVRSYNL